MQRQKQSKMCKIHNQKKGEFYIQKQPWNKLCKQCALNRAVCGYKIQKQLSVQQFQNKIILASLIQQLKLTIENCQKASNQYSNQIQQIKSQLVPFIQPTIRQINSFIDSLTSLRNSLMDLAQQATTSRIIKLQENQSKYFMESVNFKKQLEKLEDNYCDIIIENKVEGGQQVFQNYVRELKDDIEKNRKSIISNYTPIDDKQINKIKTTFKQKLRQFVQKSCMAKTLIPQPQTHPHSHSHPHAQPPQSTPPMPSLSIRPKQSIQTQEPTATFELQASTLIPDKLVCFTSRSKLSKTYSNLDQENKNPFGSSVVKGSSQTPNLTLKVGKRNNSIPPKDGKLATSVNKINGGGSNGKRYEVY